jgi:signal transduction histidine kinase
LQVQRDALPLRDCVDAVLAVARAAAYAKDVELRNDVPEDLRAQGDRRMICTILQNLISNAIKFSRRDSEVVIQAKVLPNDAAAEEPADSSGLPPVDLSVKDSGVGMPPAVRDTLFELGKRTTTRGTEDERGTGFGLQLTKQFVDLHQGQLIVESQVGCGTEIHVILPGS